MRRAADAEPLRVLRQLRPADLQPDLGEVDVLGQPVAVGHRVVAVGARRRAHEVAAPRLVGLPRIVDAHLRVRIDAALERGRAGDDLERRARRVQALRHAVDERLVGVSGHLLPRGVLRRRIGDEARVVLRPAGRGEDRAVARIDRDDRAAPATERIHRGLLHLRIDAEHDRAGRRALAEIARAPLRQRVAGVLADERLGVSRFDAGRAELEGGIASDLRQRLVAVHALVAVRRRHALRERVAGGVLDEPAGPVADRGDEARVERIVPQLVARHERPVANADRRDEEGRRDREREAANVRRERARHGVPLVRAVTSLTRMSSATSIQFVTSDEPP